MIVRAWEKRAEVFNPIHPGDPGLVSLFQTGGTDAGVDVTDATALNYAAVFACIKVLAETMGSVPLVLYERQATGKKRATSHSLYRVLHDSPNPEMTAAEFCETLMGGIGLRGNGLANIEFNSDGSVRYLWPMRPDRVELVRRNGRLWYLTRVGETGEPRAFAQGEIFHVRGLGSNGLWGWAPVDLARNSIGLGLAGEKFAASFWRNDATPGGWLRHPGKLSDEAQRRLKESFNAAHQGVDEKFRTMVAEEGMEWQAISVDPATAQALESRQFQVREIARWYRVPLHLIQDLEKATFSNIAEQSLEFVKYTMLPWFTKWAQAVSRDLISETDTRRGLFAEHLLDALLRADPKTRGDLYRSLWMIGAMSQDEIRERENMNALEGGAGAVHYVPLNMVPIGTEPAPRGPSLTGGENEPRSVERRASAVRSAEGRRRTAASFEPTFASAAQRVVAAESRLVLAIADQHIETRDVTTLNVALDDFYRDPQRLEDLQRALGPAFATIAPLLGQDAAESIGVELEDSVVEEVVAILGLGFARRHISSSLGQLRKLISENVEDPIAAIRTRLDEWAEKRPGKIARRETVEASGIAARNVFKRGGIRRLQWVAFGESCPFCEGLNGKIVGIESSGFVSKGDQLEAEGRAPLRVRSNITHPPIHGGCDCTVIAA